MRGLIIFAQERSLSMRTSRLYPPAAALLAAAAIALPASTAAREKKPDNLVSVGEPISCINPRLIRSTHVRDDQTIDFEMTGNTVYRNTLPYPFQHLFPVVLHKYDRDHHSTSY